MAELRAIFVAGRRQANANVASWCRERASTFQQAFGSGARKIPPVKSSPQSIRGFDAPAVTPEDHPDRPRGDGDLVLRQPESDGLAISERARENTGGSTIAAAATRHAQLDHIGAGVDLAQRDP